MRPLQTFCALVAGVDGANQIGKSYIEAEQLVAGRDS
jgi:hypothetical protein